VPNATTPTPDHSRLALLDGWRGISILCVLAAHMLPLGPSYWRVNEAAGAMGMALFFTLSGYLITMLLLREPRVRNFLIRRSCRILPLAVGYMVIGLLLTHGTLDAWIANLTFTLNYREQYIQPWNSPLWSLCVEIHFYLFVAVLVGLLGRRGLWLLPILAVAVTIGRIATGETSSIHTLERVDEILAGATLALALSDQVAGRSIRILQSVSPYVWLLLLIASASPLCGPIQYLRPYAAALLVGSTMAQGSCLLSRGLQARSLKYIATISYALYVIHPCVYRGWMDEGSTAVRYLLKRPISFLVLFCLAHLSTFYWEARWIALGKWLTRPRPETTPAPSSPELRTLPCGT